MQHLVDRGLRSQRRAANLVGMHRSVARYRSCRETDSTLRERLKELATQYPRYGYETLHGLLKLAPTPKNRAIRETRARLRSRVQPSVRKHHEGPDIEQKL